MKDKRVIFFLIASFFSTFGDTLLVFAVPSGLGIETQDVRSAVLMWLIPAIAMFLSTFLSRKIISREKTARRDYASLLIALGLLEVVIAALTFVYVTKAETLVLICSFVFIYALAKEGIPRLFYTVSVYRYFVDDEQYSRIAGANAALGVAAGLIGTLAAALLISMNQWKIALVLDATTFLVLGYVIFRYGRDTKDVEVVEAAPSRDLPALGLQRTQYMILFAGPLLFGLNALVWNYLPLLAEKMGTASVVSSIAMIAFLRLPGILSGFQITNIVKFMSYQKLVVALPALTIITTIAFTLYPSIIVLASLIVIQGLVAGLYWPADYSLRSKLKSQALIHFNTMVVRRLSVVQFIACLIAFYIFSPNELALQLLPYAILAITIISALAAFPLSPATKSAGVLVIAGLVFLTLSGCKLSSESDKKDIRVKTFSVSKDMSLSPNLTFSAMTILNDTSAHFFRVNQHLSIESEIIRKYEPLNNSKTYRFHLNEQYRSARGESLTSEDIRFTIHHFLRYLPDLSGPYKMINGAEGCTRESCELKGFRSLDNLTFEIDLKTRDVRFAEKLASPWLVILKSEKDIYEKVGECVLPYQTGSAVLLSCTGRSIRVSIGNRVVELSDSSDQSEPFDRELTANGDGQKPVPTLTSLSLFANPASDIKSSVRINLLSNARANAENLASQLNLRYSPLYASGWLSVPVSKTIAEVTTVRNVECPSRMIKVLLDTSLPHLNKIQDYLRGAISCPIEFKVTKADSYLEQLLKSDLGVAWFTPDFLDISSTFAPFDCQNGAACNFDWKDSELALLIEKTKKAGANGTNDLGSAAEIEELFLRKGYVAPLAEMNWWIKTGDQLTPIHPAGLFQLRIRDFL